MTVRLSRRHWLTTLPATLLGLCGFVASGQRPASRCRPQEFPDVGSGTRITTFTYRLEDRVRRVVPGGSSFTYV